MAHTVARAGRSTASLHEAGHSLARQVLLGDLSRVWVKNSGAGKSEHPPIADQNKLPREYPAKTAVIIFAGVYTEKNLVDPHPLSEQVMEADHAQARTVKRLGGFSEEEMEGFMREAEEFVVSHEKEIRAVARELNLRGRLSGEQVKKVAERGG